MHCSQKIAGSLVFPEITINDDHQIAITGIPPQMRTNPFYLFQIIPSSFFPTNLELTTGEISFFVLIFLRRKTTLIKNFQRQLVRNPNHNLTIKGGWCSQLEIATRQFSETMFPILLLFVKNKWSEFLELLQFKKRWRGQVLSLSVTKFLDELDFLGIWCGFKELL